MTKKIRNNTRLGVNRQVMNVFDTGEIARKALQLATQLKSDKKRRLNKIQNGTILSLFTAVLVFTIAMLSEKEDTNLVNFNNVPIPLAQNKDVNTEICTKCDVESEEKCEDCKISENAN